jgi:hypothetical protein
MNEHRILLIPLLVVLGACDDEPSGDTGDASTGNDGTESSESSGDTSPLEIIGEYDDNYGGHHEISMPTWIYDTGDFGVITTNLMTHDNEEQWVAGEDADASGTFVRFDWTYDGEGTLWYCNAVFDATSLQEATDAPLSDASDPATTGCGGFPWTMLTPA